MEATLRQVRGANFFGFETIDPSGERSRNQRVIRGNGDLILTPTELRFTRWLPRMEIRIPIDRVRWTAVARGHNGRWIWRRCVVKVAFSADDSTRVLGVSVRDGEEAEAWKAAIDGLAGRSEESRPAG